jgi:2-alkyl-3-oxoalkanoate reductase
VTRQHVIITGATGFIGAACVREFLERGWAVTALGHRRAASSDGDSAPDRRAAAGRLEDLREDAGLQLAWGSITERDALVEALAEGITRAGGACQALVHCAGRATDVGRDRRFRAVNLGGVENVCHAVERLGIGRLVHISTTDVYGVRDFYSADETAPHDNNRRNPYPKYKILAEEHIRRVLPASRYVILRPAFVWGPGDTTVMPRVVAFLRSSPVILHFGRWHGRNRWPLAYVGNVARIAYASATCDLALGQAYNVADPEPITMDEYYRMLIDLFLPEQRRRRSLTLPFALAWPVAALSTAWSNLLNRDHPVFDPSLYGLRHVAHSQEFLGARAAQLLSVNGIAYIDRGAALEELRAWHDAQAARVK